MHKSAKGTAFFNRNELNLTQKMQNAFLLFALYFPLQHQRLKKAGCIDQFH